MPNTRVEIVTNYSSDRHLYVSVRTNGYEDNRAVAEAAMGNLLTMLGGAAAVGLSSQGFTQDNSQSAYTLTFTSRWEGMADALGIPEEEASAQRATSNPVTFVSLDGLQDQDRRDREGT